MTVRVAVLVSAGRHPISGCPRRVSQDAQALELAMRLANAELDIIHAGDPEDNALRQYLGMGPNRIRVLEVSQGVNPYPALRWALAEKEFDLILTGMNNSDGANTGLVPYALGKDLGCPVLNSACELSLENDRVHVLQSLARGRRRRLVSVLPAVVAVGDAGPLPRQSAFALERRGTVERVHGAFPVVNSPAKWLVTPAKAKPPRLQKFKPDASAAERLQAVMQTELRTGEVLTGISPDAAAQALLDYLQREGIFSRTLTNESSGENT